LPGGGEKMSTFKNEIRVLGKEDYPPWDLLVKASPQGSIFSRSGWLSTTSRTCDAELKIYGCFHGEELVAGCPMFLSKTKGIFSVVSNVCGMMPYSGICIREFPPKSVRKYEHFHHQILHAFSDFFMKLNADGFVITNPPELEDIRQFTWDGWDSRVRYTYLLELGNLDYTRNVKRNIRKAIENGVSVERTSDIDRYYGLFTKNFEDQGLKPPVSYEYLKGVYGYLREKECGEMWIAKTDNDEWIAAKILAWDDKFVHQWSAASDVQLRKTGGIYLLSDAVFKQYSQRGMKTMNLMGGNLPQLGENFSNFNPKIVPYYGVEKKSLPYMLISTIRRFIHG
jgi:hypothetical protein